MRMGKPADILPEGLSKDEQIELLLGMLDSVERGFEAERKSMQAAHAAERAADAARYENEIHLLRLQLEDACGRLHAEYKRKYGASSEKAGQLTIPLFNEVEAAFDPKAAEPVLVQGKAHAPKKGKKRREPKRIDTSKMPRTTIEHKLEGSDRVCPECGGDMAYVRTDVREVVRFVPGHFEVDEHRMEVCNCPACSKRNAAGEDVTVPFKRAEMPALPIAKSWADRSIISHVIDEKYTHAMPLNRIQAKLRSIDPNMEISRQCMAGWVISVHKRWLSLVHERIRKQILAGPLIHMDETPTLVLKEPGRSPSSTSYMWVMAAPAGLVPACSFEYDPSRSADVPARLLSGWTGTLMTDCYASYFSLAGVRNLACLVHVRREFVKVIDGLDADKLASKGSLAVEAIALINRMFAVDNEFDGMDAEGRFEARNRRLRPLMEDFGRWLHANVGDVVPKSTLAKAVNNAINHLPHLMHVLDNGLFPLENNLAERYIRPYTVGRKNWEFSDTQNGARA